MDYLSELPHEILESIFSHLSIKEAAATSILSRRWRHLWKNIDYPILDIDLAALISISSYHNLGSLRVRSEIPRLVSTILDQHQGSTIHELKIRFPYHYLAQFLGKIDARSLVCWIKTAFKKKVKNLFLQLNTLGGESITNACSFHTLPSSFSSLVSLHLVALHSLYSQTLIDYFLLNSPLLEVLFIRRCCGLTNLKISCLKLKHFTLTDTSTECLEISAPNLKSFNFRHKFQPTISFKNVPSLKHISLEGFDSYQFIVSNLNSILDLLTQLDSLALTILGRAYITSSPIINFPILKNLKQLHLSVNCYSDLVNTLTPLLQAPPELLKVSLINLKNGVYPYARWEAALNSRYQCLEVVEIVRFVGSDEEIEFAGYLAENAASLQKIIVHAHESVHSDGLLRLERRLLSSVELHII
ncbi:probable FBD-associated F-box protein At1g32375 [Mercurialis annua]|uniref:probable FBD-associated F-box protein At1g32375 n=1 Tax=Mercurialis annua TaxID=3986 RepID=UPI00215E5007|nr:probable FBD-associated F-box protein At1g32375 [Mercurialis annua]